MIFFKILSKTKVNKCGQIIKRLINSRLKEKKALFRSCHFRGKKSDAFGITLDFISYTQYCRRVTEQQWRLPQQSSPSAYYSRRRWFCFSSTLDGRSTGKFPPPFTTFATTNKLYLEGFLKLCKKLRGQLGGTTMSRIQD